MYVHSKWDKFCLNTDKITSFIIIVPKIWCRLGSFLFSFLFLFGFTAQFVLFPKRGYEFVTCTVDELPSEGAKEDHGAKKGPTHIKEDMVAVTATDLLPGPSIRHDDGKLPKDSSKVEEAAGIAETSSKIFPQDGLFSCSSSSSNTSKPKSASRKVAFVAVKNSVPSATNATEIRLKETENKGSNKEDSFFSLLAAGSAKESLF